VGTAASIRPFSPSDPKNIGPAEVDTNPRLLGQLISAGISKNIGWADEGDIRWAYALAKIGYPTLLGGPSISDAQE
jgi:hypothetical protein